MKHRPDYEKAYDLRQMADVANRLVALSVGFPLERVEAEETCGIMFDYEDIAQAVAAVLCFIRTRDAMIVEGAELDSELAEFVGEFLVNVTGSKKPIITKVENTDE